MGQTKLFKNGKGVGKVGIPYILSYELRFLGKFFFKLRIGWDVELGYTLSKKF